MESVDKRGNTVFPAGVKKLSLTRNPNQAHLFWDQDSDAFPPRSLYMTATPPKHNPTEPDGGSDPLLRGGSFIRSTTSEPETPKTARPGQRPGSKDNFNWLPPDWRIEDRVRTSGATAGSVDKYYFDPSSGKRFRSKKEVLTFLETGSVKKQKTPGEASKNGAVSAKSKKEAKKAIPPFDPSNVPDSVEWALTDAYEDTWTPYLGDEKVDEQERASWDHAFASIIARKAQ